MLGDVAGVVVYDVNDSRFEANSGIARHCIAL